MLQRFQPKICPLRHKLQYKICYKNTQLSAHGDAHNAVIVSHFARQIYSPSFQESLWHKLYYRST